MPSDAKKREQQRKKNAAKSRQPGNTTNSKKGATSKTSNQNAEKVVANGLISEEEALCMKLEADARLNSEARSCTGTHLLCIF